MIFDYVQRYRPEGLISALLKTPGLFVIEYWWLNEKQHHQDESVFFQFSVCSIFQAAILFLALPIQHVASFYTFLASIFLLLSSAHYSLQLYTHPDASYSFNEVSWKDVIDIDIYKLSSERQVEFFQILLTIAIIVSLLIQRPDKFFFTTLACYALPLLTRTIIPSLEIVQFVQYFSTSLAVIHLLTYLYCRIPSTETIKESFTHLCNYLNGSATEIFSFWYYKLFVPLHFLFFWIVVFSSQLTENLALYNQLPWHKLLLITVNESCRSPLTEISFSIVIYYISYYLLSAIKTFLLGQNANRTSTTEPTEIRTGRTEGLATLLLCYITGLSGLEKKPRLVVLTIILFSVLGILLRSTVAIVEPCLLSLSASASNAKHRLKILLLCVFLFFFPIYVTCFLATILPSDFWVFVVISTIPLTSVKILNPVSVYCIYWYDSVRKEPWALVDEAVYYVGATTEAIEFLLASSILWFGLYTNLVGQWGWTHVFILIVHGYINVLLRFKDGYNSFVKKQEAVNKTAKLPAATKEQLEKNNDVCAICFAYMSNEKESIAIPCKHFFHRICLRRWLLYQERCPICSTQVEVNNSGAKTSATPIAN